MPVRTLSAAVGDARLPATLDALKSRLGITGSSEDARLRSILLAVGAQLSGAWGRQQPLARQQYEEEVAGGRRDFMVSRWPADLVVLTDPGEDTVPTADYLVWDSERRLVATEDQGLWPAGVYTAQYWAGWVTPPSQIDWASTTAVALGEWIVPSTSSLLFEATTAGTTSGTEPTWSSFSVGDTVTDGTVVWTAREATAQPEDVTEVALMEAEDWYSDGLYRAPGGILRETDPSGSTTYREGSAPPVSSTARAVMEAYR